MKTIIVLFIALGIFTSFGYLIRLVGNPNDGSAAMLAINIVLLILFIFIYGILD